jgi:peptidyl-tRNA hydrolase
MKNYLLASLVLTLTSCSIFSSLNSTTTIKPQDSFILGNNEHGTAKVVLQNISEKDIEVYHAPINGGKHSSQIVKPNETVTVKVEKNTALYISNASNDTVNVKLKVTGDLGLSMGYKN